MVESVLLAGDLLLLVTDDASGRLLAPAAQVDAGLGGAGLAELTLLDKVELSGALGYGRRSSHEWFHVGGSAPRGFGH
jgi:Golgi phosphoprotein 3 GPP34